MEMFELIKTIRKQLGMSQESFAKAIYVAFSTVNRWENNRAMPNGMARAWIADLCEKNCINQELIDAIKNKER